MLITRESEYAVRMIRALADNEIRTVRAICDEENIPHKFAYKILKKMEYADIVKAFYGVNGGYRLSKDISQISMFEILTINPNNLHFNKCSCSSCSEYTSECAVNKEFKLLKSTITSALYERTMDKVILLECDA